MMPVYVQCTRCGAKIYLNVKRKSQLPPIFRLKCPRCGYEDVYTPVNAVEEDVYSFACPVCKLRFFITRKPPLTVECPHCGSILRITSVYKEPLVVRTSSRNFSSTVAATVLLGALLGAVARRNRLGGAIAGGFIGALIGTLMDAFSELEAKYIDER